MDKTKNPGIVIEHVSLMEADMKINNDFDLDDEKNQFQFNLQLTGFQRVVPPEDESRLLVVCSFDVMHKVDCPPFYFTCTFCAQYATVQQEKNMAWDEFSDVMAMAHVIPYIREFVSNMTNRMPGVPPLMLPPVNVAVLIEDYAESLKAEEEGR